MFDKLNERLKLHPKVAGAVQASEAALGAILIGVITGVIPIEWTKAGLRSFGILVATNVVTALRNYYKQAPRQEWTPEQRANAEQHTGQPSNPSPNKP